MKKAIERRAGLVTAEFLEDYLAASTPVIVTDAIARWPSTEAWMPEALAGRFHDSAVQLYDDLFNLEDVITLGKYFDRFWKSDRGGHVRVPYVRWYAKLKNVDFVWADDAFNALADQWALPYFIPDTGYLLPAQSPGMSITPVTHPFPAKGIFISAAGARTRLHTDPWSSDAILCQIYGEKRVVLYPPSCEAKLRNGDKVVDIEQPNTRLFPNFSTAQCEFEDLLKPGEVLFIPAGWYHHVDTVSHSVSITWNFVHSRTWARFFRYLTSPPGHADREVLRYFADISS